MPTLNNFTRPPDPIVADDISAQVSAAVGKTVVVEMVDAAKIDVTGSIAESDRAALQTAINNYKYKFPVTDSTKVVLKTERLQDTLPSGPRQRISIDTTLPYTLTSTWQNISFGQNSVRDVSSFPAPGRYDFTGLKFIASPSMTAAQQYYIHMYMKLTHKQRPVTIQFRYGVPTPTEIPFPFPDTGGIVTICRKERILTGGLLGVLLGEDTAVYEEHHTRTDLIPIGTNLMMYGIRMQMRIVETISTVANRPKLTDCYAFIVPA